MSLAPKRIVVPNHVDNDSNKLQVRAGKDRSGEFLGIVPPADIHIKQYLVVQAAVKELRDRLRESGFDITTLKIECDYGKED
jgi:hypothetical protein